MTDLRELQVEVKQDPGTVSWNFEQLKMALSDRLGTYKAAVYSDEQIQEAKSDVAYLRKLRMAVETRRKEIKAKCLEPYELIETQAKELCELIDQPIEVIDKQVKKYEAERREEKKKKINEYMKEAAECIEDEAIAKMVKAKVYDERWLNVSTAAAAWKKAIDEAVEQAKSDIAVLEDVEEEFRESAYVVYRDRLVLSDAISKVNELRKQKEQILEAERKKQEQEAARKAAEEKRKAEEAARLAEEEKQREIEEAKIQARKEATEQFLKEQAEKLKEEEERRQEQAKTAPVDISPSERLAEVLGVELDNVTPTEEKTQREDAAVSEERIESEYQIRFLKLEVTQEQFGKIKAYTKYLGGRIIKEQ